MSLQSFTRTAPVPLLRRSEAVLGAGANETYIFPVHAFLGGQVRGTVHQDVAGTLTVEFGDTPTVFDTIFSVPRDASMTDFQYPFGIVVFQPYLRFIFTQGGGPSTFYRMSVTGLAL